MDVQIDCFDENYEDSKLKIQHYRELIVKRLNEIEKLKNKYAKWENILSYTDILKSVVITGMSALGISVSMGMASNNFCSTSSYTQYITGGVGALAVGTQIVKSRYNPTGKILALENLERAFEELQGHISYKTQSFNDTHYIIDTYTRLNQELNQIKQDKLDTEIPKEEKKEEPEKKKEDKENVSNV